MPGEKLGFNSLEEVNCLCISLISIRQVFNRKVAPPWPHKMALIKRGTWNMTALVDLVKQAETPLETDGSIINRNA